MGLKIHTSTVSDVERASPDDFRSADLNKLFLDRVGDLFVCIEANVADYTLARCDEDHLQLGRVVLWPIRLAPAGTTLTITQEA